MRVGAVALAAMVTVSVHLGCLLVKYDMVLLQPPVPQGTTPLFDSITFGSRVYELPNHLQNVMVTVSDKKIGVDENGDGIVDYYVADVVSAQDYYPFGMQMPGRTYTSGNSSYRYKFNGKEQDKETSGTTTYDYGFRIYNPALGRFLSVDPLTKEYPWNSTYAFAENDVIRSIDLEGAEKHVQTFAFAKGKDGTTVSKVVSKDYVQAKGTSNLGTLMGFGKRLTDEEEAARYIVQYYNLPADGTFSFFEFSADLNKQKYARYDYTDANGKPQSQYFSAEIVDKTFEGYRTSYERNGKILNVFKSLANLVGSGVLLKAELKAASGELKALNGEVKASTGTSTLGEVAKTAGGQKALDVVEYAKKNKGAARPGYKGGGTFANDGRGGGQILPKTDVKGNLITYKEYDVNPYQKGVNRGTERVVIGSDGKSYYTSNHYKAFKEIQQ